MTLKEAIELTLEMWSYLVEHPEIKYKSSLPKELWDKIKNMATKCPVCEYDNFEANGDCETCPLALSKTGWICISKNHPYSAWFNAITEEDRKESATAIVKMLEAGLEKETGE
jgi:hypothetical protein